jgi:hypothetical protein
VSYQIVNVGLDAAFAADDPKPTLITDAPTTNATAAAKRAERSDRVRPELRIDDFVISIGFSPPLFIIESKRAKCLPRFSVHQKIVWTKSHFLEIYPLTSPVAASKTYGSNSSG